MSKKKCSRCNSVGIIPGTLLNGERCDACEVFECDEEAQVAILLYLLKGMVTEFDFYKNLRDNAHLIISALEKKKKKVHSTGN